MKSRLAVDRQRVRECVENRMYVNALYRGGGGGSIAFERTRGSLTVVYTTVVSAEIVVSEVGP